MQSLIQYRMPHERNESAREHRIALNNNNINNSTTITATTTDTGKNNSIQPQPA